MNKKFNIKRKFISLYFKNGVTSKRKKRDVTLAFDPNDPLYEKCKRLGSSKIKEIIEVSSYFDLKKKAKEEDRNINNFIKYKLRKKLNLL